MANVINGTDLVLKIDFGSGKEAILCSTSCSVSLTQATTEAACKDSTNNWVQIIPGKKSWEMSASALYVEVTSPGVEFADVAQGLASSTEVQVSFEKASPITGDYIYSGSGYITSASLTADDDSPASWDVTISGNGELTISSAP